MNLQTSEVSIQLITLPPWKKGEKGSHMPNSRCIFFLPRKNFMAKAAALLTLKAEIPQSLGTPQGPRAAVMEVVGPSMEVEGFRNRNQLFFRWI